MEIILATGIIILFIMVFDLKRKQKDLFDKVFKNDIEKKKYGM